MSETFLQFLEHKSTFRVVHMAGTRGSQDGKLVAYLELKEIGYIYYWIDHVHAVHLETIWTEPEFRGHGVAGRLVQELVNFMKKKHPYVKQVVSDFMSQKALKAVNSIMGHPKFLGDDV